MPLQYISWLHKRSPGDPSSYADRLIDDCPVGQQFKRQHNVQSLKEMLISACVQNPNSQSSSSTPQRSSVRKNLLVELKDLENKPSTSKSVFPKSSKRKHEEMSQEWSSEDEALFYQKGKKSTTMMFWTPLQNPTVAKKLEKKRKIPGKNDF